MSVDVLPAPAKLKKARKGRQRAKVPMVDYSTGEGAREWLLCLRLRAQDDNRPDRRIALRKVFTQFPDGRIELDTSVQLGADKHRAIMLGVDSPEAIHAAVEDIAAWKYGEAVLVRGAPVYNPKWRWQEATRLTKARRRDVDGYGAAAGVDPDMPRRNATFDLDKLPNVMGLDPVLQPRETAAWVRSLLSPAVQRARLAYRFSSSTGLDHTQPRTSAPISVHFRYLTDDYLISDDLQALFEAEGEQVAYRLQEDHGLPDQDLRHFIDPRLARPGHQAFILAPLVQGGVDPYEEAGTQRGGILEGEREISVGAWRFDLQILGRVALSPVPPDPEGVEPLGRRETAAELIRKAQLAEFVTALRVSRTGVAPAAAPATRSLFDARQWLADYRSRYLAGESIGRYQTYATSTAGETAATYRVRGGVPEGRRYFTARILASLLSVVCETEEELRERFDELAVGVFTPAWLAAEWWDVPSAWPQVIARFRAGTPVRIKRLFLDDVVKFTSAEVQALDLVSVVADDNARAEIRRARKTAAKAAERAAKREAAGWVRQRERIVGQPWIDEGISRRTWMSRRAAARKEASA